MNVLVVGYGSIGARHVEVLESLGCDVGVVTSRDIGRQRVFRTIREGVAGAAPRYVVIANATVAHYDALVEFIDAGFTGRVLVEKPLFDSPRDVPNNDFENLWVGYNLRFHPVIRCLRDAIAGKRVLTVHAYVGQYLPEWRPGTDYRKCYSASRSGGGGVLRDLSHELDYIQWLFGPWVALSAIGGHYSTLEIDSDDAFGLLMSTKSVPLISMQMNYLDRTGRREMIVVTDQATYRADVRNGVLTDGETTENFVSSRNDTYIAEHQAALAHGDSLCHVEEALAIVQSIETAERSAMDRRWVVR